MRWTDDTERLASDLLRAHYARLTRPRRPGSREEDVRDAAEYPRLRAAMSAGAAGEAIGRAAGVVAVADDGEVSW